MPKELRNATVFFTRKCPYSCRCCKIHDDSHPIKELNTEQWIEVMRILKNNRIDFMLVQGNEPWLLGVDLLKIVKAKKIPYAMYASCHPSIFRPNYETLFSNGLDSLACGVDSYCVDWSNKWTHTQAKSHYALEAFKLTRSKFPKVDCQATCTISAFNAHELIMLCNYICNTLDMVIAYNFIHADIDGQFDFFPSLEEMKRQGLMLTDKYKFDMVCRAMDDLFLRLHGRKDHKIFCLEDLLQIPMIFGKTGVTNDIWHCGGNPHGGPTVDADGSLRLCAYRKGVEVPQMSIFDLTNKDKWEEWQRRMKVDAAKCPGCAWQCPRMYHFYKKNPELAKKVFVNHALTSTSEHKEGTHRKYE